MKSEEHWDEARQLVRFWLKDQKLTPARLASKAGLQRSSVTRFLQGKSVSPNSAIRLFEVIQPSLTVDERLKLLSAFGLSRFSELASSAEQELVSSVTATGYTPVFKSEMDSITEGVALLTKAIAVGRSAPMQGARMCFLAEQVFAQSLSSALIAARVGIQILVNLGSWDEVDQEISRVTAVYGTLADPRMTLSLMSARGWLAYDRGDLAECAQIFTKSLNIAEVNGFDIEMGEAHHFLALCNLGFGRSADNKAKSRVFLMAAMNHLETSTSTQNWRYMPEVVRGFMHYRRGQILDALDERHDGAQAFAQAREFLPEMALNHVELHLCEQWLCDGDVEKAKKAARDALYYTSIQQYSGGLSRAARALAQAYQLDGKLEKSLEHAIAAVCFDPYGWFGPKRESVVNFAKDIGSMLQQQLGCRRYRSLLLRLRDQIDTRQGIFTYLNHVAADRSQAVSEILQKLTTLSNA